MRRKEPIVETSEAHDEMKTEIPEADYAHAKQALEGGVNRPTYAFYVPVDKIADVLDALGNSEDWSGREITDDEFDMMGEMCRIDPHFVDCVQQAWLDEDYDLGKFYALSFERSSRLAHTFWGVNSHLNKMRGFKDGADHEDEVIEFVKRAVSEAIKAENEGDAVEAVALNLNKVLGHDDRTDHEDNTTELAMQALSEGVGVQAENAQAAARMMKALGFWG